MGFLDVFKRAPRSASVAKDRLSIIVARERSGARAGQDYLPKLQQELLAVLARYEHIDLDRVSVNIDRVGGADVLELEVVLGESEAARLRAIG